MRKYIDMVFFAIRLLLICDVFCMEASITYYERKRQITNSYPLTGLNYFCQWGEFVCIMTFAIGYIP